MRTLALLLLSCSLAFGQAFTFGDVAFVANLSGGGGEVPCAPSPTTNGVNTSFPNKVLWFKGENNFVNTPDLEVFTNNGVTFTAGKVGQAFQFSNGSEWFSSDVLNYGSGAAGFTVEFWLYNNNSYFICGSKVPGYTAGSWSIYSLDNGTLGLNINTTEGWRYGNISAAESIPDNTWTHCAATYDGAVVKLYINGQRVKVNDLCERVYNEPLNDFNGQVVIGSYWTGAEWDGEEGLREGASVGLLDEFTTYSRALSDNEIFTIYTLGAAGKP